MKTINGQFKCYINDGGPYDLMNQYDVMNKLLHVMHLDEKCDGADEMRRII